MTRAYKTGKTCKTLTKLVKQVRATSKLVIETQNASLSSSSYLTEGQRIWCRWES